jgi:hypothetical protein
MDPSAKLIASIAIEPGSSLIIQNWDVLLVWSILLD